MTYLHTSAHIRADQSGGASVTPTYSCVGIADCNLCLRTHAPLSSCPAHASAVAGRHRGASAKRERLACCESPKRPAKACRIQIGLQVMRINKRVWEYEGWRDNDSPDRGLEPDVPRRHASRMPSDLAHTPATRPPKPPLSLRCWRLVQPIASLLLPSTVLIQVVTEGHRKWLSHVEQISRRVRMTERMQPLWQN